MLAQSEPKRTNFSTDFLLVGHYIWSVVDCAPAAGVWVKMQRYSQRGEFYALGVKVVHIWRGKSHEIRFIRFGLLYSCVKG